MDWTAFAMTALQIIAKGVVTIAEAQEVAKRAIDADKYGPTDADWTYLRKIESDDRAPLKKAAETPDDGTYA